MRDAEQVRQRALSGHRGSLATQRKIDIRGKESQKGRGCPWRRGVLPCALGKNERSNWHHQSRDREPTVQCHREEHHGEDRFLLPDPVLTST